MQQFHENLLSQLQLFSRNFSKYKKLRANFRNFHTAVGMYIYNFK